MVNWNFPSIEGGQRKGVADSGIENFNGTELKSLARENCQNSLDASIDNNKSAVRVEFERSFVDSSQIPGINEYRTILDDCKKYWDNSSSEKGKVFLKEAVSRANDDKSFVLRVSDYNTTGLSEPYNYESFDGWNSLVKIDGGANKGDDKAGAFGIGKNAAFCNSYYRLVYYRTINEMGEKAAQGVSRILSAPVKGKPMEYTTGVGYYGDTNGNNPIEGITELDEINKRTSIGTDVFIYGFKSKEDWEDEITLELLESFLMSFYYEKLSAKVQDREINKDTLKANINRIHNKYPKKTKSTYGNYLALTREENVHSYSKEFHNLGTLELKIFVDQNEELDRKVLVVRKAGMKLLRLGNISKIVPFTGILELKGKELNKYFREMETVAHDNWEPGRHSNPKEAKAYYDEIKQWIREVVFELADESCTDEINVEGLSGILQNNGNDLGGDDSSEGKEVLTDEIKNIDIIERPTKNVSRGYFFGEGNDGNSKGEETKGTLTGEGDPAVRILKGTRKRKSLEEHTGKPDEQGEDLVITQKENGEKNCTLRNVRIIKQGIGLYTINFEIPHRVEKGRIEISAIGENAKANKLNIKNVKQFKGCDSIKVVEGHLETINMDDSATIKIAVELLDSYDYAMEVNVYENNK